jgi:sugar phosphate isomerase/epimerase
MIEGRKTGFLVSGSLREMQPQEFSKILKNIGFDTVELLYQDINPRQRTFQEMKHLVDTIKASGLEISEVLVQQDMVVPDDKERRDHARITCECIEAYSELGIDTINLFTGPIPWNSPRIVVDKDISAGNAWQMVRDSVGIILPVAEKKSVNIAFENVWGMLCHDFYTMQHLFTYFDSPFLGVNYDPSHDVLAGNMDIGWQIRNWGKNRIKHIHIKDAVGTQEEGQFIFPLLGEGMVNWIDFFHALDDIDYQGSCSVEFESFIYAQKILDGDWEKVAQISYDHLAKLINNLEDDV